MNKQTVGSVKKHKSKLYPLKGKERSNATLRIQSLFERLLYNETKGSLDLRNSTANLF